MSTLYATTPRMSWNHGRQARLYIGPPILVLYNFQADTTRIESFYVHPVFHNILDEIELIPTISHAKL